MSNGMCGEFCAAAGPEVATPEFKRERRYITFKLSDLGMGMRENLTQTEDYVGRIRESVGKERRKFLVIESDWPEFEPAWEEIQRRMTDKQTIMEDELGRWQDAIYKLACDLAPDAQIDGGGCDSGDPLDLTTDEISQAFAYWDNLLFDTMESVSHAKIEGSTFKAAAAMITTFAAENEKLNQQVCDECDPENYGWVHNRVEGRGACTCMIEAEPFQILLKALEKIADPNGPQSGVGCAMEALEALRAVLPLDYADGVKSV